MIRYAIPAVVLAALLACDGGESETTSSPMCVPGESVACACPDNTMGAQVCADDGLSYGSCECEVGTTAGTDSDEATDATTGDSVEPGGWVLRDKNGDKVDAAVEPRCLGGGAVELCTKAGDFDPPCVQVWVVNGEWRGAAYRLTDGFFHSCENAVPYDVAVRFTDPACVSAVVPSKSDTVFWFAAGGSAYRTLVGTYSEGDQWTLEAGECVVAAAGGHMEFEPLPQALDTIGGAPLTVTYEL